MKILTLNECGLVTGGLRRHADARPQRRLTRRATGRVTRGIHAGVHADMMVASYGGYGGGNYGGGGYNGGYVAGGGYFGNSSGYPYGGYSPRGYGSYAYGYGFGYGGSSTSGTNDNDAVDADYLGSRSVLFWNPDGSTFALTGNHAYRDQNPLDIQAGAWAYANGAIGSDDGGGDNFAIFSSDQAGFEAAIANMDRIDMQDYGGQATLFDLIETWSPENSNNTEAMEQYILTQSGLSGLDQWGSLTQAQQAAFLNAYSKEEGYTGNPFEP